MVSIVVQVVKLCESQAWVWMLEVFYNFAKRSAEPYFESLQNCNDCNIKKDVDGAGLGGPI